MNLDIEEKTISAFIDKSQQQRIMGLIKKKKGRRKFQNILSHSLKLNTAYSEQIPKNKQDISSILSILKKNGAPENCYVLSDNPNLDGTTQNLSCTINKIIASGDSTIISCIPGTLGYYENEEKNGRYLLIKK